MEKQHSPKSASSTLLLLPLLFLTRTLVIIGAEHGASAAGSVEECQQYKKCVECLGAVHLACGWCSLGKICSQRNDCAAAAQDPDLWISGWNGTCSPITSVQPADIQRTTYSNLSVAIDRTAILDDNPVCNFTAFGKSSVTNATRSGNVVHCPTPHPELLPPIPRGAHSFVARLSLGEGISPDFVTFYDCSSYTSCTECVSNRYPCDWCVGSHRCTHNVQEDCRNDILVTGVSLPGPSLRPGPEFCARISVPVNSPSSQILVPKGANRRLLARVVNIAPFMTQARFFCQIIVEGQVTQVPAQLLADTIYCDSVQFSYESEAPNTTARFDVIWGETRRLDNPDNVHVLIYQCEKMAQDCGACLRLPMRFACGWCQETNSCGVRGQCQNDAWLDRDHTCPSRRRRQTNDASVPVIDSITPLRGPRSGGTKLVIKGQHLDSSSSVEVLVGSVPCSITTHRPDVVECETGPSAPGEARVRVRTNGELREFDGNTFAYVEDPLVEGAWTGFEDFHRNPRGIPSGGIKMTVVGNRLDAVQEPRVYVTLDGDKHYGACIVESATRMTCRSPVFPKTKLPAHLDAEAPLELDFGFLMDGVEEVRDLHSKKNFTAFLLFPEPEYFPFDNEGHIKPFRSDYLTISGRNLDRALTEQDLFVRIGSGTCLLTSLSRTQITCRPPRESEINPTSDHAHEVVVEVGGNLNVTIGKLRYISQDA